MDNINKIVSQLILLQNETEWVEFKTNNFVPQTIGEYISALANSSSYLDREKAYLIFGINDKTHDIEGTVFKPKNEKVGNQELENWLATQLNPQTDFIIYELIINDKDIIVFEIDSAKSIPVKFRGIDYIRVGSYKHKLDKFPEKARKIWGKEEKTTFEKSIALKDTTSEKVLKIIDYPTFFSLLNLDLPDTKKEILEKLESEKVIINKIDKYDITNLGAVLFARNLDEFEKLSRKAVRLIFYKGNNRLETIREQVIKKGYAIGFEGLIEYLNERLPSNEILGKVYRKEVKMFPEITLRELIPNALIHQNFEIRGCGPMIEIFDDRIEISNPGRPIIDILRFIDHIPISRNEMIAQFMKRMNMCEERGSGIDKVINAVESFQLPPPKFIEEENFFKVILYGYKSLKNMDKEEKMRASYQHCCLKYVNSEYMTNQSLRERFDIEAKNYPMVSRIISETIKKGFVKDSDESNKSRKYIPFWG